MLDEQINNGKIWTPSDMIAKFGEKINNEDSVYYWCWKNNIPVFCPALTDGSIGDMIYFHGCEKKSENRDNKTLILDIAEDIRRLNELALLADKSGQLILGGGFIKHQICNANLMRNGADFSVYINTGTEYDGSDTGASPDEAVSWGKIRLEARPVKVWGEASLLFPILVAQTFAKYHFEQEALKNKTN
jgi:deoxyhypusine synthase